MKTITVVQRFLDVAFLLELPGFEQALLGLSNLAVSFIGATEVVECQADQHMDLVTLVVLQQIQSLAEDIETLRYFV